jgi:hypothetical protein
MTKSRVGLVMALIGGVLLAWGLLSTGGTTCSYANDAGSCQDGVIQSLADMAGLLLVAVSVLILLSSLLSSLKRRQSN